MKNHYLKFIFIVLFLLNIIKSEKDCSSCTATDPTSGEELKCSGTDCDEDCMWLRIDSNNYKCLSCDGISKGESKYYSKGLTVDGQPYCHKIGLSGFNNQKIIYKTKQIVNNCLNLGLYELGDICYHINPDTTNIEVKDESSKKLKCKYYNYKKSEDENEDNNQLVYYKCLTSSEICPLELNYFDADTKECFNSCPSDKTKIAEVKETVNDITYTLYRCSSQCNGDYDKTITKETALGQTKIFCFKECPEEAKCFYANDKNCIESCNKDNNEFSNTDYECVNDKSKCTSKFFLINSNRNYFHCEQTALESCPDNYPFKFTNNGYTYCLITCEDTNIPFFNNIKTYLYIENKECLNVRPTVEGTNPNYYIDEKGKQWVTNCLNANSGPFHDGEKCVESCGEKYLVEDTNECVTQCEINDSDNTYYIDEETKTCVKECPSHFERGFYNENKKCVKCGIDGVGKGFHIKDDKKCLSSCENGYRYNYKNNICFNDECKNNDYKYTASDNSNICYNSCTDIDDGAYKNEIDFVCYKDPQVQSISNIENYYFYKGSNGINKYIAKESAFEICYNLGLKYIKNSECIKNCGEDEYKVYPTSTSLGFCFSSYDECTANNYDYYNNEHICSNLCTNYYIVLDSNENLVKSRPNCLNECPNDYPFEKDKTCLQNCPKNYYKEKGSKKICLETCDFVINEEDGKKNCSELCIKNYDENNIPIFGYYYTKTETVDSVTITYKICIDKCNTDSSSDKFALEATNEPQICIGNCPNEAPYYYDTDKICLKKCKKYYNGNKCVDNCNSFIYMENNCVETCPYDAPFYIENIGDSETIKKCVTSCAENNYDYYDSNKKCINANEVPNEKMIFNGGIVDSCPTNLIKDNDSFKCKKPQDWNNYFTIIDSSASSSDSCESADGKYITTSFECISKCPLGEHFIKGNKCLSSCESDSPYYKKIEDITENESKIYSIYQCLEVSVISSCFFIDENKKQCLDDCGNLYKDKDNTNKFCKLNCEGFSIYSNENKHICTSSSCNDFNDGSNTYSFFGIDNMCDKECSFLSTKIIDISDNKCVNKCNESSDYKYLVLIDNKLHCTNTCNGRYLPSEYKCLSKCPSYTFANEEKTKCLSECLQPNMIKIEDDEYICLSSSLSSCPEGLYNYEGSQLCLSSCYQGDYVLQDTHTCVKSCSSENEKKYFYEYDQSLTTTGTVTLTKDTCVLSCSSTNKPFTREDNHCDTSCDKDPSGDYYYNEDNKICKKNCNNEKTNGNFCKLSCDDATDEINLNKYEDEKGICIKQCSLSVTGYIYNSENEYTCINNCPNGSFLDNNICYNSCSTVEKYSYNNYCVPNCPKDKRYYVESAKICLDDCPSNSPYFTITQSTTNNEDLFICQDNCKAYVPNSDSTKNSMLCLGDDCNGAYPYFIEETKNGKTIKHCYAECPETYFYEKVKKENENNIECLKECTNDYLYHFKNDNKCIELSECEYIDYETKECVYSCSEHKKKYETDTLTYCLNDCSNFEGKNLLLNYENKCVENCKENYEKKDSENKICECENLFIIDKSRGINSCLNKEEETCNKQIDYPYLLDGKKQCSDKCDGILSLDGTVCYDSNYQCPENSEPITINGFKQCFCKYKYYYETSSKKDLVCLPENSKCIRNENINRELLITETGECVEYCPFEKYTKKYGKTCVQLCPIMSVVVNDECFCLDKWYIDENDEIHCCDKCPEIKPIMIDKTKECVSTCINTEYPYYYKNKCYKDCLQFEETKEINNIKSLADSSEYIGYHLSDIYGEKGENICYCEGPWYEDGTDGGCDKNQENSCDIFNNIYSYKYTVLPTKQCVKECPDYFKYSFNEYCFSSCEEGNNLLKDIDNKANQLLINDENNQSKCKCKKLWRYNQDEPSKLECLNDETCPQDLLLIFATNECYNGTQCREEYPLLFNNKCYNKNNCPENTIYKIDAPKTCSCVNYYYIEENSDIICIDENDYCPEGYPNLVYIKNKCVKNGDKELKDLYNFNGIYYNNCPLYTIYNEEEDKCVCNTLYGYWYQNETEGNSLYCALNSCPDKKPYLLINTMECLKDCNLDDKKYVKYNDICYEECPELTKENNNGECELELINKSKNMTEFTKVITNNIVSLYQTSKKDNSDNNGNKDEDDEEEEDSKIIELVNSNLIVEFYGINNNKKENKAKHNNKNKASSSLSYIDLSECIQSIYESNNMSPKDDIIILKFDKTVTPADYLINPVEYKFFNSRNGQELDASTCGKGAIKISYSFTNIISNYDKLSKSKRNLKDIMITLKNENDLNTLTEKYNIGKEIYEEYSYIDTFNSKDNVYTDYCTSIEINGKDLLLEDRMNYLLPHYSLCEKNCTYNRTDFEEERIYCDCSFKSEFDLNREHDSDIEINENAVIQSQDGETNFPVLKCISVLSDLKRIIKNIGFYFMIIITIIEIVLLIMANLFGYKSFKLFFHNKVCINDIPDPGIEVDKLDKDEKNKSIFDEIIKTTQRLNAPPKKSNNEEDIIEYNNNGINSDEVEFIPDDFIFLYFNESDKGVRKKVQRNMLPFNVKENTKILLQKIQNVDYSNVKANGPFNDEQNLIEIDGGMEDKVNINIESINESLYDNNDIINEKNKIKNENDKELVTISEEKIYKRESVKIYKINEFDEIEEVKEKENKKLNLFNEIKIEQRLLTKNYEFVKDKKESGLFIIILTEILDKIYITKIILFIRKYEIMYLFLSVYVLYQVILLNIIAMLYDIKTIKNIWNKENYPGFGLYLGYGILSLIISWIIYIIIMCLLTNKGKYNEILNIKSSKKKNNEKKIELIKNMIL